MKSKLFCALCVLLTELAACGAPSMPTPIAPTATLIPTLAPPTPAPVALLHRELLGAANVQAACDAPPEAGFTCENVSGAPRLDVAISAATFARWRIQWAGTTPLTGDETVALRLTGHGTLAPNFYLTSGDGSRIGVPLSRFGLSEGSQTLHIPLREVRDRAGNSLDFASVNGIEIVFEWSDMQGTLSLESLQIESVWREAVAVGEEALALAASLETPAGFDVVAVAENLPQITQIDFTTAGEMLVSLQGGRIWRYADTNGDGSYDQRTLYASGFDEVVGLLYDPNDGGVWVGGRGKLIYTQDDDGNGVADRREIRVDGMAWGRHQNNGLAWNPDPDPFSGEPGGSWIYFGLGSTDDLEVGEPLNATILRFPRTGNSLADVEIVSHGNRNAYDVAWAKLPLNLDEADGPRAWQLFASENGPDFNDAPDEVNHIRWGRHYGFPEQFGPVGPEETDGDPYSGPVYPATAHASANGLAFIDNPAWPAEYRTLYVSLFGEVFNPIPVGHIVERITLRSETLPTGELTYRGAPSPFIVGLDRPLPLVTTPDGNLMVGDYATGVVYKITYGSE